MSTMFERQKFRRKLHRRVVPSLAVLLLALLGVYALLADFEGNSSRDADDQQRGMHSPIAAATPGVDEIPRLLGVDDRPNPRLRLPRPSPRTVNLGALRKARLRMASARTMPLVVELPVLRLFKARRLLSVDSESSVSSRSDCHTSHSVSHAPNGSEATLFPSDLFTVQQRRRGAIVLHLAGLIYMFIALAIVCDEFFVPSLSVLTESLTISDDVAGATFMAAGGSAPEFFTSLFGVFITQNNVGIGTIVGSATFNILCVLAFCTLFSREILQLTWWPLFRDLFFYIFALLCLVVFFVDDVIEWHEASTMFLVYVIYGLVMKYNEQLEAQVKSSVLRSPSSTQASSCCFNCSTVLPASKRFSTDSTYTQRMEHHRKSIPVLHAGAFFRSGITTLALEGAASDDDDHIERADRESTTHPAVTVPVKTVQVAPATSDTHPSFARRDVRPLEIRSVSGYLRSDESSYADNSNKLTDVEMPSSANRNGGGFVAQKQKKSAHVSIKEANGGHFAASEVANGIVADRVPTERRPTGLSDDIEKPVDMSWPKSTGARIVYLCLAPIMFPLYITLPDTKKPSSRKFFVFTFVGSIFWIAFFSYLMVWWANTIGETLGIPTEIMGLTILAAGTSIPDLITSVIVARKGLGDMAVSSSIGSNLFDICVGLPVPWLLHFVISWAGSPGSGPATISVSSRGLICSVGLLFVMLIVFVVAVAAAGWQMNKLFGSSMILAYVSFCVFSVLLETGYIVCPLRTDFFCR